MGNPIILIPILIGIVIMLIGGALASGDDWKIGTTLLILGLGVIVVGILIVAIVIGISH